MQLLYKNVASQKVIVFAASRTTGLPSTGIAATITGTISKDGAAGASTNDVNPTEIGGGLYAFDLTQAETNADLVALYSASSTADVVLNPVVITTGGTIADVNVVQISGDSTAANNMESFFDNTGFAATNSSIGLTAINADGYSLEEAMMLILSFVAGKASGATATSGTIIFRSVDDTADRITMAVDSNGNRTSVTVNLV